MSGVSSVHAAFLTRLAAVLPAGYVKLQNAYKPDENPSIILKQGYGVRLGPGLNTNRTMGPIASIRRSFTVVLTRVYLAREDDAAAKATTEKQLMEDALLISKDVESSPTIGGVAVVAFYKGDSGVDYVTSGTDRFLKTEINFEAEYFETLS